MAKKRTKHEPIEVPTLTATITQRKERRYEIKTLPQAEKLLTMLTESESSKELENVVKTWRVFERRTGNAPAKLNMYIKLSRNEKGQPRAYAARKVPTAREQVLARLRAATVQKFIAAEGLTEFIEEGLDRKTVEYNK